MTKEDKKVNKNSITISFNIVYSLIELCLEAL